MKKNLAFDRFNYILLAIGMAVVIIGFVMMGGSGSTENEFNPEIFSTMRVKIAPIVCLAGFIAIIGGIMYKPKSDE